MPDFLLEIRCEELPAGYIKPARAQLRRDFRAMLKNAGLTSGGVVVDGTARRIVLAVKKLPERTAKRELEIQGPSEEVAFKDGRPTAAAEGFARKHGLKANELVIRDTPKGRYCFALVSDPGRAASEVIAQALPGIIAGLSFPKSMRWASREQTFARPVRSLMALFGTEVVEFEYAGVKSGRIASGHPFLAPEPFEVAQADFDTYTRLLEEKFVILSVEKRKRLLREQIVKLLDERRGIFSPEDEELLDEVTNMVEWPNVVEGSFYESFLDIPSEVLVAAMKEHQRYFPVRTGQGKLLPHFLSAVDRPEEHIETIRRGHENVLRARLSDARFFLEKDLEIPFTKRVNELKGVTFQEKLGSYYDKAQRLRNMAGTFGQNQGLSPKEIVELQQAAELCKADLVTQMVGEFPSLQGIVGTEYARRAGLPETVAAAIAEHYLPRRAGDKLPQTPFGRILSLTDKFDNIAAFFSINLIPTGSADPFALRRQMGAIIRVVRDAKLRLSLRENFKAAIAEMPVADSQKGIALEEILGFFKERLSNMLIEDGSRHDIVDAVLATGFDDIIGVYERLDAIEAVSGQEYWEGLCEIVERTFNISRGVELSGKHSEKLLAEKEEKDLATVYKKARPKFKDLIKKGDFLTASKLYYESFAQPVHLFFDKVFVNVEDENLKRNRMVLNHEINRLYAERIADLSKIVFEGNKQ
jgi:glycyl-tRNA synthetase beta chain